jgi:hypothetical protein
MSLPAGLDQSWVGTTNSPSFQASSQASSQTSKLWVRIDTLKTGWVSHRPKRNTRESCPVNPRSRSHTCIGL